MKSSKKNLVLAVDIYEDKVNIDGYNVAVVDLRDELATTYKGIGLKVDFICPFVNKARVAEIRQILGV